MVNWRHSIRAQHFRKMLRDRREALDLKQTELAQRLGISQSSVSNFESGNRRFDIFWTENVCAGLELDVESFLHEYERTAPAPAGPLSAGPSDEDRSDSAHASDDASSEDDPFADQRLADNETDWEAEAYTDPEERRRAAALSEILARHREQAGPGGTKLPQRVVADAIGHNQSYVAKAEHARCKIHMANLEEMAWQAGSTLTALYSELKHVAPRPTASEPEHDESDHG